MERDESDSPIQPHRIIPRIRFAHPANRRQRRIGFVEHPTGGATTNPIRRTSDWSAKGESGERPNGLPFSCGPGALHRTPSKRLDLAREAVSCNRRLGDRTRYVFGLSHIDLSIPCSYAKHDQHGSYAYVANNHPAVVPLACRSEGSACLVAQALQMYAARQ